MPEPKAFSDVLLDELRQFRDGRGLQALEAVDAALPPAYVPPNAAPASDEEAAERKRARRVAEDARRRALYEHIHTSRPHLAALCLSGGGIRSASFSLGALQGLAKAGVFKSFNYLSTVSGGGYLGGWLSAWMREARLHSQPDPLEVLARTTTRNTVDPEAPQIRFLRFYSNFLSPRLGLLSTDTWTLAATFLRNMLLNWLVLIPLFIAVLMIPRAFMGGIMSRAPQGGITLCWVLSALCLLWSTAYGFKDMPSVGANPGKESTFLWHRLLPLLLGTWLLVMGWAWRCNLAEQYTETPPAKPAAEWRLGLTAPGSAGEPGKAPDTAAEPAPAWTLMLNGKPMLELDSLNARPLAGWAEEKGKAPSPSPQTHLKLPALEWWRPAVFFMVPSALGGIISALMCSSALRRRRETADRRGPKELTGLFASQVASVTLSGLALWWVATHCFPEPTLNGAVINYAAFASPVVLGIFLLGNFLFAGLASRVTRDPDREWWGRSSGWILLSISAVTLLGIIVFWAPILIDWLRQKYPSPKTILTAIGGFGGLAGAASALFGFSSETGARASGPGKLRRLALPAGAVIFLVALAVLLIFAFDHMLGAAYTLPFTAPSGHWNPEAWRLIWCAIIPLLISLVMSWVVNVNDFSLHAMYRNRLIRAYLGGSRPVRHPHPFTGFDAADNFDLRDLAAHAPMQAPQPLHIINTALNLVAAGNLAWQERKAEPFTMSCLHCGSADPDLGYQPSATYADAISLGTAVTISGAAANPNMGYHSSPLVALLMTLFNVRLGWWLPNPGLPGRDIWGWRGPRFSAGPLLWEAFGNTTNDYPYVNLSDGGHFENLGVYEMVLRRCRYIVAIDGGQDENYVFEDLGNAIRKIRIDLGISIDITLRTVTPQPENQRLAHCAFGYVNYGDVDTVPAAGGGEPPPAPPGLLIYIKPLLTGEEPADVKNYHAAHPEFPHESTGDQFFSESQLESYRMLGCFSLGQICGRMVDAQGADVPRTFADIASFFDLVHHDIEAAAAEDNESEMPPLFRRWMKSVVAGGVREDCREGG